MMKEVTINRTSLLYHLATEYGDLLAPTEEDIEDYGLQRPSICDVVRHSVRGAFFITLIIAGLATLAAAVQDFFIWAYFGITVGFLEPGPAMVVIVVIALAIFGLIGFCLNKIFGKAYKKTANLKLLIAVKESVFDKICVPVKFK
jgi:hypothetical protein